jgi:DNA repair protein RadC
MARRPPGKPSADGVSDVAGFVFKPDPAPQTLAFSSDAPAPPQKKGGEPGPASPQALPAKPSHSEHRARLRTRFETGGSAAMPDYELLELLLFRIVPRQDVKPLAKALLARFGDLAAVLGAAPARIAEVAGAGPAVALELKVTQAVLERAAQSAAKRRPIISSWSALLDYTRLSMAHAETEQFRVLFLDRKNQLIADEVMGQGSVDHAPVYPREIVRRALELAASALILVHNHPSGDPKPSAADLAITREIIAAAKPLGIEVHDHLVVGRHGLASFKSLGLL